MSSNDVVLSSSPSSAQSISSLRRRTSISTNEPIDLTRPRLSPTLPRSFDLNDPEARERQRAMDVDMAMAMQLSRARRETIQISPTAVDPHPPHPHSHDGEVVFSPSEQHEIDIARGAEPLDDLDTGSLLTKRPSTSSLDLRSRHLNPTQDPTLLVGMGSSVPSPDAVDRSSSNFGQLPTYQPNPPQSYFDFAPMEEFAAAEKSSLGLSTSPSTKFIIPPPTHPRHTHSPDMSRGEQRAFSDTRVHLSTPEGNMNDDLAAPVAGPSNSTPDLSGTNTPSTPRITARQRKLSQSNTPRVHRKGIGGKLAMFEGTTGQPPASLPGRLATVLGGGGLGGGSGGGDIIPTHSNVAGLSGILNTGHDRPYRFSFYSNALSATIHARSLSELPAEGQSFQDLFSGINFQDDKDALGHSPNEARSRGSAIKPTGGATKFLPSKREHRDPITGRMDSADSDGNTWWLDVQSPTDEEMKLLSNVFRIHPLTTEDIQMEETREKIELFRNYYLVCFRSFDQDPYSPTYLEPLNMYIIVFREGTLSFHFRPTPHPSNVRRRIKQLKDYISVTSDWISYALIDDITDAFGPLIQSIEYEVDSIDELVLILKDNLKETREQTDMLRRIGTCRKKVMGLLRLMGNKADVVKGLAKRCNENWQVAPTGDIGLYLSDIQDHLITMTQNLNHYEKILSRSHSNYLAQISIEMTDANNQINDVLSKLTALGTVLIPMNLVTGLWGMNVHVPGEDDKDTFRWFASIIACLAVFAVVGGYSTYKLMRRS
ncbi:CorA metal ion transporter [Marasmius crinis-equi]|uniref:CorA metal ion transporter n=1 Tax=Marasmius crinis-equi TaxID=585013 RepID=A0ABR3FY97_9AGAR